MAKVIYKLPIPSTAFLQGVKFSKLLGRKCSLEYSYENEEDFSVVLEILFFEGVESFKCTYYKAISLEMFDAYDKIIEIDGSAWLDEIRQNLLQNKSESKNLKHLRIYFDDGPCYEFICKSFEIKRDKQI